MSRGLGSLIGVAVTLVVAAIVISFGAKVTSEVSDDLTAGSIAKAAADNGTEGLGNLAKWLPTIATVAAAAVIIGFLLVAFTFGRQ